MNFTWEALSGAQNALGELRVAMSNFQFPISNRNTLSEEKLLKVDGYREKFDATLANDLNMPQALAVVWEVVKSNIPSPDKYDLLLDFDEVLGLRLIQDVGRRTQEKIPEEIQKLSDQREEYRREKKFGDADAVRKIIEVKGYMVEDTASGSQLKQI